MPDLYACFTATYSTLLCTSNAAMVHDQYQHPKCNQNHPTGQRRYKASCRLRSVAVRR